MKNLLIVLFALLFAAPASAQLYMTRNGQVSFYSETPMENIDATNNEVTSMVNVETGEVVFALLVKSFRFEKALMEEHFNENYMESDKMPKASFQGKITNLSAVDFKKKGTYTVHVVGDITIHGVKKTIETDGTLTVDGDAFTVAASFPVKPADYNIRIPKLVEDKIATSIEVKINCLYKPKQ